ncbi:MAG TPA: type II toxin-antitoxin system PemK/MazF family toxin [Chloroflexota bacterium]|jgi:mRNA interferase MazF
MAALQWALITADLEPVRGSEQRGRRPVLIVSNEEFNQVATNVTALPLTSTQRRLYPSEVFLPKGVAGQDRDSIVMAHQIRTISKQRLRAPIGYLDDPSLRTAVQDALKEHLDLE